MAAESLANVKFIQEKKLINSYFDQISQDTGKYCFGVDDTLRALEMGAVETLICWENLDIQRYSLKNHTTGELKVLHLTTEQEKDKTHFTGKFFQEPTISKYSFLHFAIWIEWWQKDLQLRISQVINVLCPVG